jgi:hypothetical protein
MKTPINKTPDISDISNSNTAVSTRLINNKLISDFVSATAAGTVIAFSSFPAEGYKKHVQSGQLQRFQPWRGSLIFATNIIPTTAIQLTTDGYLQSYMAKDAGNFQKLAASFYCGVQGAVFATVVENCILKQQINKTSPLTALREMTQQSYLRPWKSFSMIATRDGIFTAYMLYGGNQVEDYVRNNISGYAAPVARLGLSLLGTAISHPFDMVGTYMQKTEKPISIMQAAKDVVKDYGYKGFFRGYRSRVLMFYTFGTIIPFVKKHIDECIEDPQKKIAGTKQSFNSTFFKTPEKSPPKKPYQPHVDYVDLTAFRK